MSMMPIGAFALLLVASFGVLQLIRAEEVILMEPFDPLKMLGTWYVWKRNVHLTDQTSNARCLRVAIEHDGSSGDIYKMVVKWLDPNNGNLDVSLFVVDDRSHPARFFFKSDEHKIALSVLGTDYDNWAVAHGMLGLKDSYFVATRKLPLEGAALGDIENVLNKNQVSKDFVIIDHSSC
ncbi:hypothetical protein BIW11_07062 [Tropilaelaps mercedesae]|uniref:Lipocalin/cytosolic fatty-acid binding domain-containing protein n=1 Tax=Tropilaelaps mercedesae TaxID=418985 RepID=A0A1V9XVQ5_9ACAR|nr:hypothetical protein BIW11_07062 [Tropilaelaps mercedesae]